MYVIGLLSPATRSSSAPQALAALRNSILSLLRAEGWRNIAAALPHYNSSPRAALRFIGGSCIGL